MNEEDLRDLANRIIDEVIEFHCGEVTEEIRPRIENDIVAILSNIE